jgi:hypothetical protein
MNQWVTTRSGDRVDVTHAAWVQRRSWSGLEYDMPDRHLLEVQWEDSTELVAVFLDEPDCLRAVDVFVQLGWVPVLPEAHIHEGRVVNPGCIRGCRVENGASGRAWRVVIDVAGAAMVYLPVVDGMTRGAALERVQKLTEQIELAHPPSWVDPDFTRPAWRGLTDDVPA